MKKQNNRFYHTIQNTLLLIFVLLQFHSYASDKTEILRFATTKSNEVNARSGPGTQYPTEWVFIKKGEPLAITAEFEQWRYARDINGDVGWVHSSVLSGKRSVIVLAKDNKLKFLRRQPSPHSRIIAKLSNEIRCQFKKCEENWCKIKCQDYTGWIEQTSLWGVKSTPPF